MGIKLVKCYQFVREKTGMEGAKRLAIMTKISPILAGTEVETSATVEMFRLAVREITGQDLKLD